MQGTQTSGAYSGSYGSLTDKIVYYASVFVYQPKLKSEFINYSASLQSYESK
jgi:hypothetical protein